MATRSTKKLGPELLALGASRELADSTRGREALALAFASHDLQAIVAGAQVLAKYSLLGFEEPLRRCYRALLGERAAVLDPGCVAKAAVVAALDALEDTDAELFAHAACYEQLERSKSGARDTGANVRTRGVLGLARLGHADLSCILGRALADRDPAVRLSAARAVAHRGQRDGAGMLLLRLGAGDDTPDVLTECVRGVFALAPDHAVHYVRTALREADDGPREQLLHMLGTANDDAAVDLLAEELSNASLSEQRRPIIQALGLSLRPRARTLLLELVTGERSADAEASVAALAIHRYDDRLREQLEELTASSRELSQMVREHFA